MATDLGTLVRRTRRFVRDFPDVDTITASVTSAATTLVVADTTRYAVGQRVELDYETMIVRALASATNLTVGRGMFDSTAAVHASGASVLRRPAYLFADYVDALNMALDATFPYLYKEVEDTSLTTSSNTYDYNIPTLDGVAIPWLTEVSMKWTGDFKYRPRKDWRVLRGATPQIRFAFDMSPGTLMLRGYGSFPHLSASTDSLDAQFPSRAERLLTMYAGNWVLMSGEAGRVRHDSGAVDAREQATKAGSAAAAATNLLQRFQIELAHLAMPPLARHAVPTFPTF